MSIAQPSDQTSTRSRSRVPDTSGLPAVAGEDAPLVRLRLAVLTDEGGEEGAHRRYAARVVALGWDVLLLVPAAVPATTVEVGEDGVRVMRVPVRSPDQLRLWTVRGVAEAASAPRKGALARVRLTWVKTAVEARRAWRWNTVSAERTAALEEAYGSLLDAYAPDAVRADEELCITVGRSAAARAVEAHRPLLLLSSTIGPVPEPARLTELAELAVGVRTPDGVAGAPERKAEPGEAEPEGERDDEPAAKAPEGARREEPRRRRPRAATSERVVRIGPANMAGQGWAWGRAVERRLPGTSAEVVSLTRDVVLRFPADRFIDPDDTLRRPWQLEELARTMDGVTHALAEGGLPVLGRLHGPYFDADAPVLDRLGIPLGLVFHGSDIRDPARHRELEPDSPFADADADEVVRLQRNAERLAERVADFAGPIFVATPDLIDDVPSARWLPIVIDTDAWTPGPAPLERERPVVVHAPSNRRMKGTERVEPAVERLAEQGLIDYRRVENVPPQDMPALIREADIVLDHFVIGNYSVLTCQAMAAGRVTLCHVADRVRRRVPAEIPVVEAGADTVAEVLEGVLADREAARRRAAAGPDFVRRFHDGEMSASVLAEFLGVTDR